MKYQDLKEALNNMSEKELERDVKVLFTLDNYHARENFTVGLEIVDGTLKPTEVPNVYPPYPEYNTVEELLNRLISSDVSITDKTMYKSLLRRIGTIRLGLETTSKLNPKGVRNLVELYKDMFDNKSYSGFAHRYFNLFPFAPKWWNIGWHIEAYNFIEQQLNRGHKTPNN